MSTYALPPIPIIYVAFKEEIRDHVGYKKFLTLEMGLCVAAGSGWQIRQGHSGKMTSEGLFSVSK